ncbi:nesprin-1 [Nematolebias whitei]|uniref:nesprin-1 n=1 Tax=Nematolebias whitei TaxID=451745 RepID=UPI00189C244F|nr:nesprin-1 [Nematolebias whitei]
MAFYKDVSVRKTSLNLVTGFFQYLRDEQEAVQKRTFTKWINSHLAKHKPPLEVNDLFEDIKDGLKLLALLEVLSGQRLPCEQGRQLKRIHWVSNIGTALKFLEGRKSVYRGSPIKLVNIHATDIADGRPSIVLGLIWTIILYFQIEELTSNLPALQALSNSNSSVESLTSSEAGSPPMKRKVVTRFQGNAKKALLRWVQCTAAKHFGIEVKDFGPSWRDGVAFQAVVHAIRPDLVDMEVVRQRNNRDNLEDAFTLAENELGIPRLLDPEDVDVDKPDEKSIMTYVAQFLKHYPNPHQSEGGGHQDELLLGSIPTFALSVPVLQREERKMLRELKVFLDQLERDLLRAQAAEGSLADKYQVFKSFHVQYEMKKKQTDPLLQPIHKDSKLSVDQAVVKQAWDRLSARLLDWHIHLDKSLPGPLGVIGAWLHRAEMALREDIPLHLVHEETANVLHRKLEQHKEVLKSVVSHRQTFVQIHKDRSVNGVPVPPEQLQDMAERFNFVSTSSHSHLIKLEFWEMKYRLMAFLGLAESKLKSWIIKYGRRDSVELLLQSYLTFTEGHRFFEQYEIIFTALKQAAEVYVKSDSSIDEAEGVSKFLNETTVQWKNLALEVRSVRSMLEEVICNWEKYSSTVAALQAWLEDAEQMVNQSENAKRDFFRNFAHWIQQHMDMNDAGNFLIETCDEMVSRDLKQQLLLLNGRWRELFVKVKHYARADEVDKLRQDYHDGINTLKIFMDATNEKMTAPVQVSFLNVRTFVQDVEEIKHKVPAMEAACKAASRTAQLLTKDTPQEEISQMMTVMASIKEQLSKVRDRCLPLLRESQSLLPPLEEMEKNITGFYQALEKASHITSSTDSEGPVDFKQKCQELATCTHSCKKCLTVIERNHQSIQKIMSASNTLQHMDMSLLQKRVADLQSSSQNMIKESTEWRKHVEANSSLMKRFDESRLELEKILKTAQDCLTERGNPEELIKKHTEFFGQLDQRALNTFLKACDELTDILPEQEQQSLQETVRKLHKHWKDIQTDSPFHLLHLKVEVERNKLMASLQECQAELTRENRHLTSMGSERLIKEHRAFFREKGPQSICEKRLQVIEELCQKLPESDPAHQILETVRKDLDEVREEIENTHQKLMQHPDKWKEYNARYAELSCWLISKESQLRLLRNRASDPRKYGQVKSTIMELRNDAELQEGNLGWLKARMAVLIEICADSDAQRQGSTLSKLSTDFKGLLTSLLEAEKMVLAVGDCVQFREEVQSTLEDLVQVQKEAQAEATKILDCSTAREAQQLLLVHQQQLKRLKLKRKEVQHLVTRGQQLQAEEGLGETLQQDLHSLENTLSKMEQNMDSQEKNLEVTLAAWQEFDSQQEAVREFVNKARSTTGRDLNFSSPESLAVELDQAGVLLTQCEAEALHMNTLLKRATEIQLGPRNKTLLSQQARSLSEQVQKAQTDLKEEVKNLEGMKSQWDRFGAGFEAFSSWISEKEKEVDVIKSSSLPLEEQLKGVKTVGTEVQDRAELLSQLETDSQALAQFVSSGEAARIKARLTQIGRYWEDLKESVQQLDGQLEESSSHQQKFKQSLEEARASLCVLHTKLKNPVKSCSSSSETYKALQTHTDVCQGLEQLKGTLLLLSSAARRLSAKEEAVRTVTQLNTSYELDLQEAKDKQSALENLLSLWQKYEKQLSNFTACLERSESASKSESPSLSADKAKLHAELQELQALQLEEQGLERAHADLVSLGTLLHPTAPEERVIQLKDELWTLQKRLTVQQEVIPQRIAELQSRVLLVEQFDEALLKFSEWSESTLSNLHSSSQVNIKNLQHSAAHVKETQVALQLQSSMKQSLEQQTKKLCEICESADAQLVHSRVESCLQPYVEAQHLAELQSECLERLEAFLQTHGVAAGVLRGLKQTVESAGSWDRGRVEELQQELATIVPDISQLETVAVNLDSSLCKGHLHIGTEDGSHTSCRLLADSLSAELDAVRNVLGSKQSEAEALGVLWTSFRQRKEQLLKAVEDIEEKADHQTLKEPSLHGLQQRLRFFNQLEDELQSHQHEEQWLREKGNQLAHKDAELAGEVLREIGLLETTWEDTKRLITEKQEQCSVLVELMKEYQVLKTTISSVTESAKPLLEISSVLKDHEETKRTLTKHEAMKGEIVCKQRELDQFSAKGKHLLIELKKVPECNSDIIKKDLETIVDQWLDMSERIDDNTDHLHQSLGLWDDVRKVNEDIESWTSSCVIELNERLSNFNNSQNVSVRLSALQAEIGEKKQQLELLQSKVSELKKCSQSHETPAKLQVLENDLQKKINTVQTLHEQVKRNLADFSSQRKQLEDYISQMSVWLKSMEDSLVSSPAESDPEDICRVKDLQKDLQNQQGSIDSTRESLNNLCRKYPSEELSALGSSLTDLIKTYESVNQLSARTLSSLQNCLQQHFSDLVQDFHCWLSEQREIVKECSDRSGDTQVVERKLQKLKGAMDRVEEGEMRLTQVCEEGEKLLLHLPKASSGQVQQHLSSIQQDWDSFVEQCRQNQQILEDSACLMKGFEGRLKKLRWWLEHMENRMTTDLREAKQRGHEKVMLDQVEEYLQEVLKERDSFERLCQEGQALNEGGRGDESETRVSAQLHSQHQALLRRVREKLHSCQLTLQEQQAFEETLQTTWSWLNGVQERLASLNSTIGNKETLEKRLGLVQDILLMKGEGEVKLNMAVGKGEQVLKHSRIEGQETICSQLQSLKDSWANMLMNAMSCHSRLEWTVAQWSSFQENKSQLQQWMELVEQEVGMTLPQQPDLKKKCALLERLRAIQADVDTRAAVLSRLTERAVEMQEKTGDHTFGPESRAELNARFADISAVVKGKVQSMQKIVSEHEQYLDAVRDFDDWLVSAKEELQRWSDLSGDSANIQRKLSKVQELLDSKQRGRERLSRVQRCGVVARDFTSSGGYEALEREEATLLSSWEQWERTALQTRASLETALSQISSSEQEFSSLSAQLEQALQDFSSKLKDCRTRLTQAEGKSDGEEAVKGWHLAKDTLEELIKAEAMSDRLKTQLNDLCRFSREMGSQSDRVSALIKDYNSLSLQATRECQNKEKMLDQAFRSAFREFQQWLVNAKINTAKCFDAPQNLSEASSSLQKIQEFLSDKDQGQSKVNAVVVNGEHFCSIAAKDKTDAVRVKTNAAREDWKNIVSSLHNRETSLQNLLSQMKDFEASAEPLQECLNATELTVQESSTRLYDLTAKKLELHKLQSVLEELTSLEVQLSRLKEKAQLLWDEHSAGKGFAHRISQLSAQYLSLTNLTKEKASRIDRIVTEHQLFSQGLKELQNWMVDTSHMLQTYSTPTADKNILDSRMIKLEALLTARQEKEIQLKMLITRGESVQRNTSAEGVPLIHKQIQDLKDSWDALLSAAILCKSQLERSLSQWTSYQEDVCQFVAWIEHIEEDLELSDKQCPEIRDKTANLSKAKLLYEDVLSHNSLLETITVKSAGITENYVTQLELQELQERYNAVKDNAMRAVGKAEDLVKAHQEYQQDIRAFEEWLEQEQEKLGCYTQLEGDVDMLEDTIQKLQELQLHCTEGQALLNTLLLSREPVIPWGLPQIEERALETLQQEWRLYQARLADSRAQLNSALAKLRQMEQKFQRLDSWLKAMETKAQLRSDRRSDRDTKNAQLQMVKSWQEEVLVYQEEMEGLTLLAQQVLDETHISSRISTRATQITARYHALLLHLLETIKQIQEEVCLIEEAQCVFNTFSEWLSTAQNNFSSVAIRVDVVDRFALERKMKKLESLQADMEQGHLYLKTMREKTERVMAFLEEPEADQLKEEVDIHLFQLEELMAALRTEHSSLEKCISLSKDYLDKYKSQSQWVVETKNLLSSSPEPKAELYQKKAQLAKYKTIQQTVKSHESAVKSVVEKGEVLLEVIHDPTISENMKKLQADYQDLCLAAQTHVQNLVEWVKEHEDYNSELQEVEKWLLQMSSRLVTSDSMQTSNMEVATQQLARHKAIMEEIASFEERLISLKQKGEGLVASCSEQVQVHAKISQQVQTHLQGTRDSYSAICSTAQRVYQSLDRELQKHVSHQDTLQQCQTWLTTVQEELQLNDQGPSGLQEALKQVKHYRALQEQASTYLDLVCSVCDLSHDAVRVAAAEVQQIKLMIEERMSSAQVLSEVWRELKEQKQDLSSLFQDMEQQLLTLSRRPAELETKIAQNMLFQAKECCQQLQSKQSTLTKMTETVNRLTGGQNTPEHAELDHLTHSWLELCHQANKLQSQREEDLQRSKDYHDCIAAVEELFEKIIHGDVIMYRQNVEKLAEQQQSKYLDLYTILPSEISMQLAEVSLALGAIEDQVLSKERENQRTREIKEDFSSRIHDMSEKLKKISNKFKDKSPDLDHAKEEVKSLLEDLDSCGRSLSDLDAAVQEFSRRNPLLAKQLSDAINKMSEMHHHTSRLADCRNNWLKKAVCYLDEYNEMLDFIVRWCEKAKSLVRANIIWNSSVHLQEQIRMYQAVFRESRELHGDLESMAEKVELLSEVLQVESMSREVCDLSRHTDELQQSIKTRLQSLQDAHKSMEALEFEVKALHVALEQVQATLTSPELARQSLKEQLAQRQRLLADMESFKQQVQAVQLCQSALQVPEEVMPDLSICRTALRLQQEASQLQHVAIQQCNILQEAVVQYEQYEQEVKDLQGRIEEAHRVIQDRPIPSSNIQELQAQILHHEELAQRIKGYQEQIASLNSKCKMLAVKAKHATMLLTVSDVEGLPEGLDEMDREKSKKSSAQFVTMTAGRCHTLLSPVTEESGEETTNSEVSFSPLCRSPSPVAHSEGANAKMGRETLTRAPIQELYDPTFESVANLDDLQRSWETLKNVISEKQRSLYEALEKQQHYQSALQSISSKMEALEAKLSEPFEADRSPDSHMTAHEGLIQEIQRVQEEIDKLQTSFSEDVTADVVDSDRVEQLAMQSSLSVLAERMATIYMKASGKQQQLEDRATDRLETQLQQQAIQTFHAEAEELDQWLAGMHRSVTSILEAKPAEETDEKDQLSECQNMLLEIEEKVSALSELSLHSETLLLEGRTHTRGEAERLAAKLHTLKSGLLELQRMLQDKQLNLQGSLQEPEDSGSESSLSQSPSVQDWLAQARTTRTQQQEDSLQRQKELEEQLAEQKKLLQSVASRGEEILIQQASPGSTSATEPFSPKALSEAGREQMRQRWESLRLELKTKLQLLQKTLEQDQSQQIFTRASRVTTAGSLFKGDAQDDKCSLKTLYDGFRQTVEDMTTQPGVGGETQAAQMEQQLYTAVSSTSSWLDGVENNVLSGSVLPENAETQLQNQEILENDVKHVVEEVKLSQAVLAGSSGFKDEDRVLLEDNLDCLKGRLAALGGALGQRLDHMRTRAHELTSYQTDLQLLQTDLIETKCQILQALAAAMDKPVSKQLEVISSAEESLKDFEHRIMELKARGAALQADQMSTNKMLKLQDSYEELMMMVGSRRSGMNQSVALKEQYERALQDLRDLVDTAKDKTSADQRLVVSSMEEVQNHLDKHKEFFQGLESHMILTETYFRKISGLLLPKECQALEKTLADVRSVLKEAHGKGVKLESILQTWSRLMQDYQSLNRQLEAVEENVPSVGLMEEDEDRLMDRISLYQGLKGRLAEHQHKLHQVLDEGKHLLQSVCCPALENQLSLLGEHWLNNTSKVNKELQRLEATLKHWTRYQKECVEISGWLQSALERLEFWNTQAVLVPQELESVRDHLSAFLEFSKEVEGRSNLKSSVVSEGNQLLRLKKVDTLVLRSDLARIDSQWTELLTRIPVVQEKLHQIQMEKLASRHAISELFNWISLMENVIEEDEENLQSAVGSNVIQDYLQKYKGFRVDLSCKQLTVDFVNQSVLQISGQDVESKRSDKTDFAERLGAMNRRWQLLQGRTNERIQFLESLLKMWLEYESSVQVLKSWMAAQEERLKRKPRIEDLTSVQNALKNCQEMEALLKEKEKDLERVEEQGCALVQNKTDEACAIVMETLQSVNHTWANLDHLIGQLKISLTSVLDQWSLYKRASEEISGYLMEGRYSVSRFRLLTGSLEAVQQQVQSLQDLQEGLEKQESSLRKFGAVTQQLLRECHPSVSDSLNSALKDVNARWNGLLEEIAERLRSSKALLQLWQRYKELYEQSCSSIQLQEDRANQLLKSTCSKDMADEDVTSWIQECSELLRSQVPVQASLQILQELGEQLKQQVDTSAASAVQSDHLSLRQRLSGVEQALNRQLTTLQTGVQDFETFNKQLESLASWVVEAEEVLRMQDPNGCTDLTVIQERMEELKKLMLKFSCMAPELEHLNELGYKLPLNDSEIKRMQNLNRSWSSASAQTTERFSKIQSFLLQQQTFLEKCETWMDFLVQTEDNLAVEISGNYQSLMEQQKAHELFQAEMFSRQQILHSIISDGQKMLEQGQVDDRDEFNMKLALLSNQWQGVVRRSQQRRGIIDGLIRQWQQYREMVEKLHKWLSEVSHPLEALQAESTIPLQQARSMLDAVQLKEKVLQRQQGSYILTVEAGRQLLLSTDSPAETALQAELSEIQNRWKRANTCLEEHKRALRTLLKDWEGCERGIAGSLEKLRAFKRQLSQPLPDHHEDLQVEQLRCKDLESTCEGWTGDLAHLTLLRESLSCYISSEDLTVLQERVELLHQQWDEIIHQLSLRRQQVGDKLNEWTVFNDKYKELCEWLTRMESKVSQNGDISIEEMIEKLRKDYQEEITVAEENKQHLHRLGERLARASNPSKAADIEQKLSKVNDRWQHLLDLIGARAKKLRETLVAVQQLDKNMSSLRSWLAHVETELSKPVAYESCDFQEIQRMLDLQQELQRDIEKHSTGVASVLNLCEVLLHDCDACATDTECDSIQQATRSLDRRWRSICALSMERRLKIEETWRLWQKFLDDFARFEEWLSTSEKTAALPNSSGVLYTVAKEELKKFETFQRQVQESLTQLELINKQYRRLARENRTDSSCRLREMAHEANQRWDNLQKRVASILRRLKHFISQREEFETARDGILVWLTEMDLQLTNIEHFSECDIQAKIKQLRSFQQEISLTTAKIEHIFHQGEALIEKSEPMDAAVIEEELEELQRYCQEVFGRVERYYKKLIRLPLADDDTEVSFSDRELDLDEPGDLSSLPWNERLGDGLLSPLPSSGRSASLAVQLRAERSGRDTPASVDSIPLEWDHDYDLSRGLESASRALREQQSEEGDFLQRPASDLSGETASADSHVHPFDISRSHLQQLDTSCSRTPTSSDVDASYMGYLRLLGECRGSIDTVKRVGSELKEEEDTVSGLADPSSSESQTSGVIERWELLQAQDLSKEIRTKESEQQWQQLNSDLNNIWTWLGETEEDLGQQQSLDVSTDIQTIELRIKKLKELQKAYDKRKAIALSINLCSTDFLQSGGEDTRQLQARLKDMNNLWDKLGSSLEKWRSSLQEALMQCQEFHEMSHGLLLWLENIDRRRNEVVPIDPIQDTVTLHEHHKTLTQIRQELLDSQLKVASLQDMSLQLLVNSQGSDCLEAKEKVHVIGNRLKLLLKEVTRDLRELAKVLDITSSQQDLSSWSSADELDTSGSLSPVSGRSTPSRQRSQRGKCSLSQPGPSVSSPHLRYISVGF